MSMNMNMKRIDNVQAHTLEPGDNIERWIEDDSEEGRYSLETVSKIEDDGEFILIYTEEMDDPDVPWAVDPYEEFSLFGYPEDDE